MAGEETVMREPVDSVDVDSLNAIASRRDPHSLWDVAVGLEVHAQVSSSSKLFSAASTGFGGSPNDHVDLFDVALPGTLPLVNAYCVEQAVRTGLAIHANVHKRSVFDRKNYFYPDLPLGYQITQFYYPICTGGYIEIDVPCPGTEHSAVHKTYTKKINIERMHIEQDAGKAIHDTNMGRSLLDYNRAGIALMEIVSKPELSSAHEVQAYVKKLRTVLRYVGTCDGNMEQGSLRVDVNVSVRPHKAPLLGTRCEIKNVNSVRFIGQAIAYEANRQIDLLENGLSVLQETRLFNADTGETRSMRMKEDALDYRYFPEPDLLPLIVSDALLEKVRRSLPELPDARKRRFIEDYGLTSYDAGVLTSEREFADYFEKVPGEDVPPKLAASWITGDLFAFLNKRDLSIARCPLLPEQLACLLRLLAHDKISGPTAKKVFERIFENPEDPEVLVEREGLYQVSETGAMETLVDEILSENPQKHAEVMKKPKLLGWFVGQVMAKSGGRANPKVVGDLLRKKLHIEDEGSSQ